MILQFSRPIYSQVLQILREEHNYRSPWLPKTWHIRWEIYRNEGLNSLLVPKENVGDWFENCIWSDLGRGCRNNIEQCPTTGLAKIIGHQWIEASWYSDSAEARKALSEYEAGEPGDNVDVWIGPSEDRKKTALIKVEVKP